MPLFPIALGTWLLGRDVPPPLMALLASYQASLASLRAKRLASTCLEELLAQFVDSKAPLSFGRLY